MQAIRSRRELERGHRSDGAPRTGEARRGRRWRNALPGLAAFAAVVLGVLGFDILVQEAHTPSEARIDAAEKYVAAAGKDYELGDCKIPLSGDELAMNCDAETASGRSIVLSFGFTPEGTVAVMCEVGTEGCDGN